MVYPDVNDRLSNNGHEDVEEESQEQLESAALRLKSLTRGDGSVTSMGKQELGLLQKILATNEKTRDLEFFRMCDFVDDEEALDHTNAYFEAKDTGMDTDYNIARMFALCSANRPRGFHNNLISILTDTLQHAKWANTKQGKNEQNGYKSRSPISDG